MVHFKTLLLFVCVVETSLFFGVTWNSTCVRICALTLKLSLYQALRVLRYRKLHNVLSETLFPRGGVLKTALFVGVAYNSMS